MWASSRARPVWHASCWNSRQQAQREPLSGKNPPTLHMAQRLTERVHQRVGLGNEATMNHDTSKALYAYWNGVRGSRPAPRRFEIEPARLAGILPETFILERLGPGSYRFRLAGTKLCEQFGTEFRGQDFLSAWKEEDRTILAQRLDTIADQGGVGLFEFEARGGGLCAIRFEMLIVPLAQSEMAIDRLLGAMSAAEDSDWIAAAPLSRRRLLRDELIECETEPLASLAPPAPLLSHVREARLVRIDRRCFRVYEGGLSLGASEKD